LFSGATKITGNFYVAEFTEGGESGSSRELTLTLESTGPWELIVTPPVQMGAETFGIAAEIKSLGMAVVAAYPPPNLTADAFGMSASIKSLELPEVAEYQHTTVDADAFGVGATIKSLHMPQVVVAITFGAYPWLAQSAFSTSCAIKTLELRPIPQPDIEPFGIAAEIKSLTMAVTANYETAETGADAFGVLAEIKSLTMAVTASYAEHDVHDPEAFGISATIKSLTMSTV
jgi:hypothetical protein